MDKFKCFEVMLIYEPLLESYKREKFYLFLNKFFKENSDPYYENLDILKIIKDKSIEEKKSYISLYEYNERKLEKSCIQFKGIRNCPHFVSDDITVRKGYEGSASAFQVSYQPGWRDGLSFKSYHYTMTCSLCHEKDIEVCKYSYVDEFDRVIQVIFNDKSSSVSFSDRFSRSTEIMGDENFTFESFVSKLTIRPDFNVLIQAEVRKPEYLTYTNHKIFTKKKEFIKNLYDEEKRQKKEKAEREERERIERYHMRIEKERLEKDRIEREKVERERQRLENERLERERIENERIDNEKRFFFSSSIQKRKEEKKRFSSPRRSNSDYSFEEILDTPER